MLTFEQQLDAMPFEAQLNALLGIVSEIIHGRDVTLAALRDKAEFVSTQIVVIGGAAVIRHGYERTTIDRDVLVDYRNAYALTQALLDDPDWDRANTRQSAFIYGHTGVIVDFRISRDLMTRGRPYYFPDIDAVETVTPLEGIPVLGINDLVWFKLLAGRMRDLADIMELCKLNPGAIDPDRVLASLEKEDDDLRTTLLDIIRRAPLEIAQEQRLGQGEVLRKSYEQKRRDSGINPS